MITLPRRIVQFAVNTCGRDAFGTLFALDDDGMLWSRLLDGSHPPWAVIPALPDVTILTDDDLTAACYRTTARLRDPAPAKAVIAEFVEKSGMSVVSIAQDKRAAFIEKLDAIGAPTP